MLPRATCFALAFSVALLCQDSCFAPSGFVLHSNSRLYSSLRLHALLSRALCFIFTFLVSLLPHTTCFALAFIGFSFMSLFFFFRNEHLGHYLHSYIYKIKNIFFIFLCLGHSVSDIATILGHFAPNLILFEPLSALYHFFKNKYLEHYFPFLCL